MAESTVRIPAARAVLDGDLGRPDRARGLVLFAHGSGSGRHSPRNRYVAAQLQAGGLATVLVDLLTPEEDRGDRRFDIALLAERLGAIVDWLPGQQQTGDLPVGLFGASTGAAAALVAAANRGEAVRAVVSRGGRPDLAGAALREVHQPTLLIVGGNDEPVIDLNRTALRALAGEKRLDIVPGATHLFEEPGALEEVARLAGDWFARYLGR